MIKHGLAVFAALGNLLMSPAAMSSEVKVAVAANFTAPMEKLGALFLEQTGSKLVVSYGATGKFHAQIKSGAPFEVFLSADQEHSKMLIDEKLAVEGSAFTYAVGKIVLWSPSSKTVDASGEVLGAGNFKHLAIANPRLAPYGAAAQQVLEKKGLWQKLKPRIVMGENIAQTFQFVSTGNAELGFVALSQVQKNGKMSAGSLWLVPQELYAPLRQDAVLLAKGKASAAARHFLDFLRGDKARAITRGFGYE